ncbi:heat shock protein 70 family [Pavlovales sp. CCMP2436]|nr:heat shock protein 70 family [Pavlovales sp. CCMP2436]
MRNFVPEAPSTTVGIDLGTTFSCVAVFDQGRVHVIEVEPNSTILPSAVAVRQGSPPIVGRAAFFAEGYGLVYDAKRFIGRAFEASEEAALALEAEQLPFSVRSGWSAERGRAETHILPRGHAAAIPAEEVSAIILRALKAAAEKHIGRKVRAAVLAVPVDFTEEQRNATREAARLAGIEVLRLLHEPTAAAIAYGLHQRPTVRSVMVYDLGGGTLDVSVLDLDNGIFSVASAAGNNFLGGQDVNRLLLAHVVARASPPLGALDGAAHAVLFRAVEALKIQLSDGCGCTGRCETPDDAEVSVPLQLSGRAAGLIGMSRAEFERVIGAFVERALLPVHEVLGEMQISIGQVDELVLVGGSTRIPAIRRRLTQLLGGKEPNCALPPEEAVARGTAIQAGAMMDAKKVPVGATEAVYTRRRAQAKLDLAAGVSLGGGK